MSLARAFTTKRSKVREISAPLPHRSMTMKQFPTGTIRHKISAPVELVSTTNMLSYNAPDIHPRTASLSSQSSGNDSDSVPSLTSSPVTSPDDSSAGSSPTSPEPNHLSCYFVGSGRQSTSSSEDAPIIPVRALSHTKKSHEMLSRKRSISRMSSGKNSVTSFARDSIKMFSANVESTSGPEPHPFGNELAQVTELAEEYGVQDNMQIVDEEERELVSRGLFKFDAEDYMSEIESYFTAAFCDPAPMRTMWI